jgi:hypothetical protein
MGADLITAIVFRKEGVNISKDFGLAAAAIVSEEDLDNSYLVDAFFPDGIDDYIEARQILDEAISDVADMWDGCFRSVNIYSGVPKGFDMLIVGLTSWGDSIPEIDSVCTLLSFPDVMKKMGMEVDIP